MAVSDLLSVQGIYGNTIIDSSCVVMIGPRQLAVKRNEKEEAVGEEMVRQVWIKGTNASITLLDNEGNWQKLGVQHLINEDVSTPALVN